MNRSARPGVIIDQTGALSFIGIAKVNIAKMVIDDLNDRGGPLGRPVELFVEDSTTDDSVAEVAAARLVERAAGHHGAARAVARCRGPRSTAAGRSPVRMP